MSTFKNLSIEAKVNVILAIVGSPVAVAIVVLLVKVATGDVKGWI